MPTRDYIINDNYEYYITQSDGATHGFILNDDITMSYEKWVLDNINNINETLQEYSEEESEALNDFLNQFERK